MRVVVTGANGFVGSALCSRLRRDGAFVRGAIRKFSSGQVDSEFIEIGDLSSRTDWTVALKHATHVVHLAARVHLMRNPNKYSLGEFRRLNVDATANLARQAADAGVRRFIFLSSVKVNGDLTLLGKPFTVEDKPYPTDPYGVSKREAELILRQIATETGMDLVVIRPPLVYGKNVGANFESMMRWLARGVPLPLAGITENRRSLVALDNLVDLISICLEHPAAADEIFLVSDGEDLSTADLLNRLGLALGHPARLFYVHSTLLKLGATALKKTEIYRRLSGSLQVDLSKTRELLSWTPPVSVDDGLVLAAQGFIS